MAKLNGVFYNIMSACIGCLCSQNVRDTVWLVLFSVSANAPVREGDNRYPGVCELFFK